MEQPTQGHHQHTNHHKLPTYSALPQVESWLGEYLGQKAPQLPEHWRKNIAKFGPWITLVILVLTLPALLALLGFGFAVTPVAILTSVHYGIGYWFFLIGTLASLVLEAMALSGLFKLHKQGWVFIFYAALITAAVNILSVNIGGLIGSVLCLYILFQIKNQYK